MEHKVLLTRLSCNGERLYDACKVIAPYKIMRERDRERERERDPYRSQAGGHHTHRAFRTNFAYGRKKVIKGDKGVLTVARLADITHAQGSQGSLLLVGT